MGQAGNARLMSGHSDDWWTPPPIIDAARASMGGIDLDPASCSEANETVAAARWIGPPDDGLSRAWGGKVWVNPPFSQGARWVRHVLDHARYDACCLLFGWSNSATYLRVWKEASYLVLLRQRKDWSGPSATTRGEPWNYGGLVVALFGESDPSPWSAVGAVR